MLKSVLEIGLAYIRLEAYYYIIGKNCLQGGDKGPFIEDRCW